MTLVLKKIDDVPAATARWIENLRFINHAVLCYLAHRLCKESPACKQAWHEWAINYAKGSIGVPTPEEKPERYGYVELRHFCSLVAHRMIHPLKPIALLGRHVYQLPYLPERIAVHKMCEWGILAFANPPRAVPRRNNTKSKSALQLADKSCKEAGAVVSEGGREDHGTSAAAATAKDHYTADSTITTAAKSAVKAAKSGGRSTTSPAPSKKRASTGRPSGGAKPTTTSIGVASGARTAGASVLKKTTNKPGAKKIILRSRKAGTSTKANKPAAAQASGIQTGISQVQTTTSTTIKKTAGDHDQEERLQQDDKVVNYVRGEKTENKGPRQEPKKKKSSNARGQSRKIKQEKKEKVDKQRLTEQLSLLRTELQASRNRTVGGTAQAVPVTTATGAAKSSASKQKRNKTAQQAKSSRKNVKTQQATTTSVDQDLDVTGNRNKISTRKMLKTGVDDADVLVDEKKKRKTVLMNKRGAIVGEANNEGKVVRYDEGKEPAEKKASSSTRPAPKDNTMDNANTPGGGEGRATSFNTATKKAKGTPNALKSASQVDAAPREKMSAAAPSAAAIGSSAGRSSATGGIKNVSSELQRQPRFNISDATKAALLSAMHEKRRRREQEKLDVVDVSATAPGKMTKSRTTQMKSTTSAKVAAEEPYRSTGSSNPMVPSAHQLPGGTTAPAENANRRPGSAPTAPGMVHDAKAAELASSATTMAQGTSTARTKNVGAPADTSSTSRPSTVAIYLPKNFVPLKVPHRYFSEAYESSLISTCTGMNSNIKSGAASSSSSTRAAQDRDRQKDPGGGARRPASLKRGRDEGQRRASEGGANKAILPSKQRLPREGIDYPKPPEREPVMPERKAPFITTGFAAFGGPHGVVAVTIPGEAVDEKGKKVLRKGVPLNQRGCYECRPEDFVQIKGQWLNRWYNIPNNPAATIIEQRIAAQQRAKALADPNKSKSTMSMSTKAAISTTPAPATGNSTANAGFSSGGNRVLSAKPSTVGGGGPSNITGGAPNKKIVLSSTTSGAGAGTTSSAQQNRTLPAGTTATASNKADPINVGPAITATTSQVGGAKKKGTDPVKMGYLQQKLQEQKQKMKERAAAAAAAAAAETTNGAAGPPTAAAPGGQGQGQPQTLPPTPGIVSSASSASSSGGAPLAGGHQQQGHLPAPPPGIASAVPSGSGAASTSGGSANVKDLDQEPTPQQPSPSEGSTGGGDLAAVSLPGVLGGATGDPGAGGQLTTSSSGPGRLEFLRSKLVHARKKKAAEQAAAQAALSAQSSPAVESSDGGGAAPGSSEENNSFPRTSGDVLVDQPEDKNSSSNHQTSSSSSSSNKNESPGGTSSSLEDGAFLQANGDKSTSRVQLGVDHQSHNGVLAVPPGAAGGEEVRSTTSIAPNGGGAPVAGSRLAPGLQQAASGAASGDAGILGTAAHAAKAATSKKTILLNKRSAAEQANTAGDADHDDGLAGPALKKKKTLVLRRKKGTTEQGVPVSEIPAKKQKSKDGKSAGTTTGGAAAQAGAATGAPAAKQDKEVVNSKLNTKDLREPEHERQGPSPTLMSSTVLDHTLSTPPGGLVDVTLLQHPITSTTSTRTPAVLTLEAAAAGVKKDSKQMEQKQDQRPGAVDSSSTHQQHAETCAKPVALVPETPPSSASGRQHAQASLAASAREVVSDGPSVLSLPAVRDSREVNGRTTTRNSRKNEIKPSSVVEPARDTSSSSAPPASASAVSVVRLNSDSTQSAAASGQHKKTKEDGELQAVKTTTAFNSTSSAAPASASRTTSRPEQVAHPHQSQTQLQPSSSSHHPSSSSSSTTSSIGVPTGTMDVEQGSSGASSSSAGGGTTIGMRRQDHLRQKLQELKQKRGGILSEQKHNNCGAPAKGVVVNGGTNGAAQSPAGGPKVPLPSGGPADVIPAAGEEILRSTTSTTEGAAAVRQTSSSSLGGKTKKANKVASALQKEDASAAALALAADQSTTQHTEQESARGRPRGSAEKDILVDTKMLRRPSSASSLSSSSPGGGSGGKGNKKAARREAAAALAPSTSSDDSSSSVSSDNNSSSEEKKRKRKVNTHKSRKKAEDVDQKSLLRGGGPENNYTKSGTTSANTSTMLHREGEARIGDHVDLENKDRVVQLSSPMNNSSRGPPHETTSVLSEQPRLRSRNDSMRSVATLQSEGGVSSCSSSVGPRVDKNDEDGSAMYNRQGTMLDANRDEYDDDEDERSAEFAGRSSEQYYTPAGPGVVDDHEHGAAGGHYYYPHHSSNYDDEDGGPGLYYTTSSKNSAQGSYKGSGKKGAGKGNKTGTNSKHNKNQNHYSSSEDQDEYLTDRMAEYAEYDFDFGGPAYNAAGGNKYKGGGGGHKNSYKGGAAKMNTHKGTKHKSAPPSSGSSGGWSHFSTSSDKGTSSGGYATQHGGGGGYSHFSSNKHWGGGKSKTKSKYS
ncbi:unnamed protein product [Amoebophrya sp. A120]|nr:unnamed protein product [Amoebophrya sp. A120]|eukprot:GSA120T00011159001.1